MSKTFLFQAEGDDTNAWTMPKTIKYKTLFVIANMRHEITEKQYNIYIYI